MANKFDEKHLVEDFIVEELEKRGWKYISPEELPREDLEEPLLIPILFKTIQRINKNIEIDPDEIHKVINSLKLTPIGLEGNRQVLKFLKEGVPLKLERTHTVERIKLIDHRNPENNNYIVTRQFTFKGREYIRPDILLFVNGIPVVNIECKNPASLSETWVDAYKQIKRYEEVATSLYKFIQIGIAAEAVVKYFPIVPGVENVHTYEWKESEDSADPLIDIVQMLTPSKLLDIIANFLFYREEKGVRTKVITRYMQYRAANKIYERVINNLKGLEDKKNGLIWHWQGSGKTLTMIFAAHKLYFAPELETPSIFFIVDRLDLEDQLSREFNYLDLPLKMEIIQSIGDLKSVLCHDNYRGKRGVFITLIHKFRHGELKELDEELERYSLALPETIKTRKNVILLIDEGHRSQYGVLAAQMRSIFKNAFAFAFTGTPLALRGRDTFKEFAYPGEELYLDKYFVVDSLKDGFTVRIVYQPRLEKDVHLKKELLEAFLESELEELPEELREDVEKKLASKLNQIKIFLEHPQRIEKVVQDIVEHFKENLDGRFKGMVATVSRTACVLYKREFDKLLPPDWTEVVMTFNYKDHKIIEEYKKELQERFPNKDMKLTRDAIISNFKETEKPKILIVTDMLLTGFDAPILQSLYLVKPLKGHRLLQAIARVNRPFGDIKTAGLVLDYIGILKQLKRAFAMYNEEDIKDAIRDYSLLEEEFIKNLARLHELLVGLKMSFERETLFRAFEIITESEETEREFVKTYKETRRLFELLGPSQVKLDYIAEYKWFTALYSYYIKQTGRKDEAEIYKKYYGKTLRYIYESTEVEKIRKDLPEVELGEKFIESLEKAYKRKEEKAASIVFALNRMVLVDKGISPVHASLAEKVEKLVEQWRAKTRDYEKIYKEGLKILEEVQSLNKRQKELGFNDLEYGILLVLEENLGRKDELVELSRELYKAIEEYLLPGWLTQSTLRKRIEREARSFVRKFRSRFGISLDEIDKIYADLLRTIKRYGIK